MDTLERYYIYKETKSNNQINDKLTVKRNVIFKTLIHEAPYRGHSNSVTKRPKRIPVVWRHLPRRKWKLHRDRKPSATTHKTSNPLPWEKSVTIDLNNIYIYIYIYIYQGSKQLERLVKPRSVNYRLRQKETVCENTGPQQSATNKKKIHLLTYSIKQSPSWEANWFCS